MLFLALNILFSVSFGHVMKWSTHRQANLLWVGALNYLTASGICAMLTLVSPPTHDVAFTTFTGLWGGVCYLVSLLYYFVAVERLGMGLATSAIRLSVAMPVAVALLVWREQLHPAQAVGLALVTLALPLLGSGKTGAKRGGAALMVGLMIPLFVVTGAGQVAASIYNRGAPAANIYLFLACVYGGAAISALIALRFRPVRPCRQDALLGLALGVVNLSTNIFLLQALRHLPSSEVFSVSSTGSVVLATLTGVLFWRERISRQALGGVVAAAVAVVLLTR